MQNYEFDKLKFDVNMHFMKLKIFIFVKIAERNLISTIN